MDTKKCTKCKEEKDVKKFPKNKRTKDGLNYWCKGCTKERNKKYYKKNKDNILERTKEYYKKNKDKKLEYQKEYYENNKDIIRERDKKYYKKNKDKKLEYQKEYYENNKDIIRERDKKYYENNKDKKLEYQKEHNNSPISFNSRIQSRKDIELYEEVKESNDGYLMCKCTYCGEWYVPNILSLKNRLKAINGGGGECRLYCSDGCKQNCPSYQQILYFKDQIISTSREVQPELRQMVFERDNYTCQKCDIHKYNLDVGIHCHHIEGILWEPLESADIDMCITYCADCHKEVHKIDGCGYHEMKCA